MEETGNGGDTSLAALHRSNVSGDGVEDDSGGEASGSELCSDSQRWRETRSLRSMMAPCDLVGGATVEGNEESCR